MGNPDNQRTGSGDGVTRRKLMVGAVGLGAGAAAVAALPGVASAGETSGTGEVAQGAAPAAGSAEQVVLHVRDARTGEFDLYVGDRHVRLTDKALAARITSIAATH